MSRRRLELTASPMRATMMGIGVVKHFPPKAPRPRNHPRIRKGDFKN